MLKAKLVVVGGDAKAGEFNLSLPTVIGRGKEAGLTIPHALVSRAHTELFERDGRLVVKDLGSLNGTFVNNTKIEAEQVLEPSQLLTLGNVTFRAIYEIGSQIESAASMDAGATLNDRNVAATLVAPEAVDLGRETFPEPGSAEKASAVSSQESPNPSSILEGDTDAGSALSEIDSFEPDDSDSFGRLSEINSNVFSVQTRGPARPDSPIQSLHEPAVVKTEPAVVKTEPAVNKTEQSASVAKPASLRPANGVEAGGVNLGIETGHKDVAAVSSIDGLPSGEVPQVSFVGQIGDSNGVDDVVDSVKIDLGDDKQSPAVDESRLGSFLKRLPK
jgi:pSer/pThr/pTyr-binding forkhead associated (FHA) protein